MSADENVRLDKWLQVARVFKTRTRATRACAAEKVTVNGQPAKAHRVLAVGDRIEVRFGDWYRVLVVRQLRGRPIPKKLVTQLFDDLSLPRPRTDPIDRILAQSETRERGLGRPTKRDRRALTRLKGREADL